MLHDIDTLDTYGKDCPDGRRDVPKLIKYYNKRLFNLTAFWNQGNPVDFNKLFELHVFLFWHRYHPKLAIKQHRPVNISNYDLTCTHLPQRGASLYARRCDFV